MKKYILVLTLLAALCFEAHESTAQRFRASNRYTSVGLTLNALEYFGDLSPRSHRFSFDYKFTKPHLGAYIQRRIAPKFSARLAFAYGRLKGDDYTSTIKTVQDIDFSAGEMSEKQSEMYGRWLRNLNFVNDVYELSATVVYDFVANRGKYSRRPSSLIPYAFAGVGGLYQTPKTFNRSGDLVKVTEEEMGEKVNKLAVSFPLGLGLRYKLTRKLDLSIEAGYRWTLTDQLDGTSQAYHDVTDAEDLHDRSRDVKSSSGEIRNPDYFFEPVVANGDLYTVQNTNTVNGVNLLGGYGHASDIEGVVNPRGNSKDNDQYLVVGVGVSYIIAPGVICPKF